MRNLKNFLALAPYRRLKKAEEAGVALVAVMEKKTRYLGNATVCRNRKVALYYDLMGLMIKYSPQNRLVSTLELWLYALLKAITIHCVCD